ncbi:MAG: S41 family peptidase [Fimbriimonas sp.]
MFRRAALLLCLVPTMVWGSGPDTDALVRAIGRTLKSEAYAPGVDFSRWPAVASRHRASFAKAKTQDQLADALNVALGTLGASHVTVFTPDFMKAPFVFRGAGILAAYDEAKDETKVWRVFPGSSAEKEGVRPGDLVLEEENLFSGLDGNPAKPARLKIRRGTKELEFRLQPLPFEGFPRAELDWVDATTAVLSVPTFTPAYDTARIERLMAEAAVAQRLVLDLRYNGGGKPWNVEHLLGFFLPDRAFVGSFVSREESVRFGRRFPKAGLAKLAQWVPGKLRVRRSDSPFRGKVVVLVNEHSGSAAEVAAQALREIGRVPVFGEATAGAVLMSEARTLPGGFELVFPKYDYVSAQGRRLERKPVRPDVMVATSDIGWPGNPDSALRWIAKYLEKVSRTASRRENIRVSHA